MKTIAACFALLFALVGCSGKADDAPTQVSPTTVYLNVIRAEYSNLEQVPDETLVDLAKSTCDAVARGVSLTEIAKLYINAGFNAREGGYITGAGMKTFCPEELAGQGISG